MRLGQVIRLAAPLISLDAEPVAAADPDSDSETKIVLRAQFVVGDACRSHHLVAHNRSERAAEHDLAAVTDAIFDNWPPVVQLLFCIYYCDYNAWLQDGVPELKAMAAHIRR